MTYVTPMEPSTRKFWWGLPLLKLLEGSGDGRSWNARNGIIGIKIWRNIPNFFPILCQEKFEIVYKWCWGLVFASPFWALAAYMVWSSGGVGEQPIYAGLIAFVGLCAFLKNVRLWTPLHREMEIIGHTIEWVVAVRDNGVDSDWYFLAEAMVLANGYSYGQFDGVDQEKIIASMKRRIPSAEKWVRRNYPKDLRFIP